MIIRFSNRKARAKVIAARKALRDVPIYINEHLTSTMSALFASTRKLKSAGKIAGTWTWNCKIYVKTLDERIHLISSQLDLGNHGL